MQTDCTLFLLHAYKWQQIEHYRLHSRWDCKQCKRDCKTLSPLIIFRVQLSKLAQFDNNRRRNHTILSNYKYTYYLLIIQQERRK